MARPWSSTGLQRFGSVRSRLFILALFLVLSLAATYPLVLNLSSAVPGPPGRNLETLYDLWWFRHSLVELKQWPGANATIFSPFGADARLAEPMLLNKLLSLPVLLLGKHVLAYNVLVLLTFVGTAYGTYLLLAYLTDNRYAAVVGAVIFAFSPYRLNAMAAGRLSVLSTQWLPLMFLYVERMLRERRARHALVAGLLMGLNALSCWTYALVGAVGLVIFMLARLRPWSAALREAQTARNLLLAVVVALALILPTAIPALRARGGDLRYSLADVSDWSASVDDFFVPNLYHPLWGRTLLEAHSVAPHYPDYAPGGLYLGAVALLLTAGAAGRRAKSDPFLRALVNVGLMSALLALGPVLRLNGEIVQVRVSPGVEQAIERVASTVMGRWALNRASYAEIAQPGAVPIPLPGLLLYLFAPWGNALLNIHRFGALATFMLAVLSGLGAARMLGGIEWPKPAEALIGRYDLAAPREGNAKRTLRLSGTAALLVGLLLFDVWYAPLPYGLYRVEAQPVDRWLAEQPGNPVIMQFPLARAFGGPALYGATIHGHRVAYGPQGAQPAELRYSIPMLATFPSAESLALLRSWGVTQLIVGAGAYDAGWGDQRGQSWASVRQQLEAAPGVRLLGISQDQLLWTQERVSSILSGYRPVVPVLVDQVYVYELR